jgi:hypothetical protein
MIVRYALLSLILLPTSACSISDDDRCPPGYRYVSRSCSPIPDASIPDASIPDASISDRGLDAGRQGDATSDSNTIDGSSTKDGSNSGLGDPCSKPQECAGKQANFCAAGSAMPTGFCTYKDCTVTPDSCPSSWSCCDRSDGVKLCVPSHLLPIAQNAGICR